MKRTKTKVRKHTAETGPSDEPGFASFDAAHIQWLVARSRMKLTAALDGDEWDKAVEVTDEAIWAMIRYRAEDIRDIRHRAEVLLVECRECMEIGERCVDPHRITMLAQALCTELNRLDVHQELPALPSKAA